MTKLRVKPSGVRARALMLLGAAFVAPLWGADCALAQGSESKQESESKSNSASTQLLDLNEYIVEGNTVLDARAIERAVYPFLGPQRSLDDVEGARSALERAYAAAGFQTVYVEIPQQNVTRAGILKLRVVEGRVGAVDVAGADYHPPERVLQALPSLRNGAVPNLTQLNRELMSLNAKSADLQVTPDIRAGGAPGQIDVTLNVEDQSGWHGSLGLNNQYSRDTSELRANAGLRFENLWGRGHEIGGFYSVAPENRKDGEVFVLAYAAPLPAGYRFDLSALKSNSDVATLADTSVNGKGESVTASLSKVLSGPTDKLYQSVQASLSYKNFEERVTFSSVADEVPIEYYPVNLAWTGMHRGQQSDLTLNAGLTFAFRGLGSNLSDFDDKRFQATGGFTYLSLGASYRRDLPKGFELFAQASGQVSNEPLVSNEQFALGGAGSVRGYLQSEALGDNGILGSVEVRSPDISKWSGGVFDEIRLYGAADAGRAWLIDPLPEQIDDETLASLAFGVRFRLFNHVSGQVEAGQALEDAGITESGDGRVHFRLGADF